MKTTAQPNHETTAAAQQGKASSNPFQLLQNKAPIGNPFQLLAEEEMLQPKFNPLQFVGTTLSANSHPVVQRAVGDGLKKGTKVYDADGNRYKIRKQTKDKTEYQVRGKGGKGKKGKKETFPKEALFMKKPAKAAAGGRSDTDSSDSDSDSSKRRSSRGRRSRRSRSPKKKNKSRSRSRDRSKSRERDKKHESKQQGQTKENNKAASPAAAAGAASEVMSTPAAAAAGAASEVMRAPAAAAPKAKAVAAAAGGGGGGGGAAPAKVAVRRMPGAALPPGYKPEQPEAAAAISEATKVRTATYPGIPASLTNKAVQNVIDGLKSGTVAMDKRPHQDSHFTVNKIAPGYHFYLQDENADSWKIIKISDGHNRTWT